MAETMVVGVDGTADSLAGSVAQKLIRHSPVSVLVVRDGQAHRLVLASTKRAG